MCIKKKIMICRMRVNIISSEFLMNTTTNCPYNLKNNGVFTIIINSMNLNAIS